MPNMSFSVVLGFFLRIAKYNITSFLFVCLFLFGQIPFLFLFCLFRLVGGAGKLHREQKE